MLLSLFSPWEWKGVDYLGYQCIHQWIELHWPGLLVLGGVTWFHCLFNCLFVSSFWNQKSSYGFTEAMLKIQCSNKHSQTAGAFNLSPFRLTFPRNFFSCDTRIWIKENWPEMWVGWRQRIKTWCFLVKFLQIWIVGWGKLDPSMPSWLNFWGVRIYIFSRKKYINQI